jgi:hypothetical protein
MSEILFKARLRYSSSLSFERFSIFSIILFCKDKILRCLQNTSKFSIFSNYY